MKNHRNEMTNTTRKSRRIIAILLVLALIPDLVSARYGSCGRNRYSHSHHYDSHPRRYNSHWGNWGWNNHHGCGRRSSSCYRRRQFHPVIDLFQDVVDASLNSLARQRKKVAVQQEQQQQRRPRYFVEDYGKDGLELILEIDSLTAREIDLELTHNDEGSRVLIVSSFPKRNRGPRPQVMDLYETFVLNDDSIDVDGITANVSSSSGILTISLPRKQKQSKRKRPSVELREVLEREEQEGEDILVYDTKRGDYNKKKKKKKKRSGSQPIVAEEETFRRKGSTKDESQDDGEDDGLWISEEEDIW